jgi:CRP/FNR family transcriptional regulator, cyclic AMP receptor protein
MSVELSRLKNPLIFRDLPDHVLQSMAEHFFVIELAAGETLFNQGDPGDSFFILEDGQIHVQRTYPDGEHVVLATEGPYYVVGELSMLANEPRTGSVVTVGDSTFVGIKREDFIAVCDQHPEIAMQVLKHMSTRLYGMNLQVREHALTHADARVATVLLLNQSDDLPYSRIARAAATDTDIVEHLVAEWVDKQYITHTGQTYAVKDLEALKQIAG